MISQIAAHPFGSWRPGAPSPPDAGEATLVGGCDTYVRSPITTHDLEVRLEQLSRDNSGAGSSPVRLGLQDGSVDLVAEVRAKALPEDQKILPLRLDALRQSIDEINRGDSWLSDRNPVFYVDRGGMAHIDFTNLAGFIVDPMGHVLSRSVNPA